MAASLQADYSDILESSLWELQVCVVLVSIAGGAVAFHSYNAMWGILGFWKNTVKMPVLSLPCFKRTNMAKDAFLWGLLV